jgi:hypothetical protein
MLFMAYLTRPALDLDVLLAQADPSLPHDADARWAVLDAALVRVQLLAADDAATASGLLRLAAAFDSVMGERLVRALRERLGESLYALDAFDDWAVKAHSREF